jgi:hypothetical protein
MPILATITHMISRGHLARSASALAAVAALTGVAQANTQTFPFDLNGDGVTGTATITRQVVNGVEVAEAKLEDATWGSVALVGLPTHGANVVLCRTADFDGDGIRDLAVGLPGCEQRGIVALFSGAKINPGKKLSLGDASRLFRSAFEDDKSFGASLGVLPPVNVDAPVTLRIASDLGGTPRAQMVSGHSGRVLAAAQGDGPLTNWDADSADLNSDGVINGADLEIAIANLGMASPATTSGDINADGAVDLFDLELMTSAFAVSTTVAYEWSVVSVLADKSAWKTEVASAQASSTSIGVRFCARPIDGWYENWPWWLAPFNHAYLEIDDWTRGFDGSVYPENTGDGRSRKCWEAKRKLTGKLHGTDIDCASATPQQIQDCIKKLAVSGTQDGPYDLITNNCGDWVKRIADLCCADVNYLPWLIY